MAISQENYDLDPDIKLDCVLTPVATKIVRPENKNKEKVFSCMLPYFSVFIIIKQVYYQDVALKLYK